ncbi:MAG: replication-associated recombination protein A, partial [bacterium]
AIYWLALMLTAGEDPRFIARRLVILAAEDVGNADPMALTVATSTAWAVEFVGMPEAQIPLAEATIYLATAPKSNASYSALLRAQKDIQQGEIYEVPRHLRDASYRGAEKLGHGEGYLYPHNYPEHYVPQVYLPVQKSYYRPTDQGYEKRISAFLARLKELKEKFHR